MQFCFFLLNTARRLICFFVASLVLVLGPLVAAEGADTEQVDVLGAELPVNTSVSHVNIERYTGFPKVIDRSAFENNFTELSELIDHLNGVQVNRTSGAGSYSSTSIRGAGGKQVNYFLDGMLLNLPNSGFANISIPTSLIERIEVFPDFTPVQLTNANLGGAISFTSRYLSPEEIGGQVKFGFGSFSQRNIELSGWTNISNWQTLFSASSIDSENNYPVDENLFATASRHRINDGFSQKSILFKLGKNFSSFNINSLVQYINNKKEIPTENNRLIDDATTENENFRAQSILDYKFGDWSFANRVFYLNSDSRFLDLSGVSGTVGLGRNDNKTSVEQFGLYSLLARPIGDHFLQATLELSESELKQIDQLRSRTLVQGKRTNFLAGLSNDWRFADSWLVNTTYRYYFVEDDVQFLDRSVEPESRVIEPSYQVGIQWELNDKLNLLANFAEQIRVPTVHEKYGSQGTFVSDPELQHESATAFDVGFRFSGDNISFDSNIFYKEVENGIFFIYSQGVASPENAESVEMTGVESKFTWSPISWFNLAGQISLFDSENNSVLPDRRGNEIPGVYHQNFGISSNFYLRSYSVSVAYFESDDLYFNPQRSERADKKQELNFDVLYDVGNYAINFSVRNLFDENYSSFYDLPTPGRSYSLSFKINL